MSETAMLTLTDFLLARIAEDEARGQETYVIEPRPGSVVLCNGKVVVTVAQRTKRDQRILDKLGLGGDRYELIVGERVLAECEAKRRIVDAYATPEVCAAPGDPDHHPNFDIGDTFAEGGCVLCGARPAGVQHYALRILALPYADHPDYREEWWP